MAFYNRKMAENKALTKAWKAGHQAKLDEDEEICLPEICGEIGRWMRRDRRPRSRLSLRSFSVLLSGTIRLYRKQVDQLLKDTFNCSFLKKPTTPKLSLSAVDLELLNPESPEDESYVLPEIDVARKTVSHGNGEQSKSTKPSDYKNTSADNSDEEMSDDESTVFTASGGNQQFDENQKSTEVDEIRDEEKKRDQIVQTSTPEGKGVAVFDPNLPFAYVIVHDSYHSRIPSKILFSNLTENVKFLPFSKPMN